MKLLERLGKNIGAVFNWVALAALSAMLFVVATDIVGAKLFAKPFPGALDLLSLLGVLIIGFSTAKTYMMDRHIRVTFVSMLLPPKIRQIVQFVSLSLCLLLFLTATWRILLYAWELQADGESSITVNFPLAPFAYALGISFIPVVIIIFVQLHRLLKGQNEWTR